MKYLSFDIEISDEFDVQPGEDLAQYGPFHISVAATVESGGNSRLWYSAGDGGVPARSMDQGKARELLAYLVRDAEGRMETVRLERPGVRSPLDRLQRGRHGNRGQLGAGLVRSHVPVLQPARISSRPGRGGRGDGGAASQTHGFGRCAAGVEQGQLSARDGLRGRRLPDYQPGSGCHRPAEIACRGGRGREPSVPSPCRNSRPSPRCCANPSRTNPG